MRVYQAKKLSPDQHERQKSSKYLTITGSLEAKELASLSQSVGHSAVFKRYTWPAGGAYSERMQYQQVMPGTLEQDEDLYFAMPG
ncbi:hypothetical protein [Oceaniferula spumae]|uniref:hypothetical protein n=1 Tax=Oceaniferula spumae TaxID=2979115 RepID=UPI003F4F2CF3